MKELTVQDIERMVHEDETRVLEVKQTTGEIVAGMQSGCAFLNTDGGWLLFGIHPTKLTILGQNVADKTRQDIAIEIRKFAPAIDLSAQYIPVPGREGMFVIAIYFPVSVNDRTPYTYDGRPYWKVENTTMLMPREMFDERIRLSNPKKFSWELTPCDEAKLRDIDNKTLVAAINKGIAKGRIPTSAGAARSTLERLRPFNVLTTGDGLTNGAVVLFGKEPARLFSHCRVKLARFEGTVMDKFRDQVVVEANLFQQLQAIEVFCRKHMFMSGDQDDFDSKNVLTVPLKVVREAALNLLAHRTWWNEARVPSMNIFDDRVEFMNPGAFPPGTGPKDFLKRPHSEPVNEKIATALFKGGEMEGWGRGIPDIYELCKEAGMPEPEFDIVTNFVCLTIRFKTPLRPYVSGGEVNDRQNDKANDRRIDRLSDSVKTTYLIIKANPGIQRKRISEISGKSIPTVDRHIAKLVEENLIEHRDSDKTGGYYPL